MEKRRLEKRKNCDSSSQCSKKQKLSTSTESLAASNELSAECKFLQMIVYAKFRENKTLAKWQNHCLLLSDIGKSNPSHEFLTS